MVDCPHSTGEKAGEKAVSQADDRPITLSTYPFELLHFRRLGPVGPALQMTLVTVLYVATTLLLARGVRLTKQLLKPGDKVTVTMMVAKNGQPVGRIHRLVLPDGRLMVNDLP